MSVRIPSARLSVPVGHTEDDSPETTPSRPACVSVRGRANLQAENEEDGSYKIRCIFSRAANIR